MAAHNKLMYEMTLVCSSNHALKRARAQLKGAGIALSRVAEVSERGKTCLSYYTSSREEALTLRRQLAVSREKRMPAKLRSLKSADWQTRWKKDFKPFRIAEGIRIVPAWFKGRVKAHAGVKDIYIGSIMAFGTGMHPTTRGVTSFLEEMRGRFSSFLDVGAGTGILGLVAAAYGAKTVAGVDICPDAVATARENYRLNRCPYDFLEVMDLRERAPGRRFDFVAANILAPVLIGMRDTLVSCVNPGGFLAVSGIWKDDYARFSRWYALPGLRNMKVIRKDGWVSALFRKENVGQGGNAE